jgi:hypothetical protein
MFTPGGIRRLAEPAGSASLHQSVHPIRPNPHKSSPVSLPLAKIMPGEDDDVATRRARRDIARVLFGAFKPLRRHRGAVAAHHATMNAYARAAQPDTSDENSNRRRNTGIADSARSTQWTLELPKSHRSPGSKRRGWRWYAYQWGGATAEAAANTAAHTVRSSTPNSSFPAEGRQRVRSLCRKDRADEDARVSGGCAKDVRDQGGRCAIQRKDRRARRDESSCASRGAHCCSSHRSLCPTALTVLTLAKRTDAQPSPL